MDKFTWYRYGALQSGRAHSHLPFLPRHPSTPIHGPLPPSTEQSKDGFYHWQHVTGLSTVAAASIAATTPTVAAALKLAHPDAVPEDGITNQISGRRARRDSSGPRQANLSNTTPPSLHPSHTPSPAALPYPISSRLLHGLTSSHPTCVFVWMGCRGPWSSCSLSSLTKGLGAHPGDHSVALEPSNSL